MALFRLLSLLVAIVCFSTLSATAMSPTAHPSPSPHPIVHSNNTDCVAWVDRCTGEHHCTAGGGNSTNTATLTPPNCHPPIPADLTPAPGVCTHINGSCQFVDPCVTWNKYCYGADYQCTEEFHNSSCEYRPLGPAPPPTQKCLPINGSCQQYNPCRKWPGFCGGPYQCITDIQYYRYTHGPQPGCPEPLHHPIPPGECIYQHGECVWSNCTSWLDVCAMHWYCGTQYDRQSFRSLPISPCPPFPGPLSYLPQPGPCNYSITAQQCNYIVNKTHPCETAICDYGTTCEVYAPTNTAYCQASCHINNGGCPTGDKCTLVNMTYCNIVPNCPKIVKCTPALDTSPCATIKCSVGYRCMVDNITGTGYCDPSCDLNNGGCPADQQCVLKQVQCITSPCPPVVECTEGPMCVAWVDRCTGEHHCTAGGGNSINTSTLTPPNCYPPIPADLTPAPGVCTHINGSCQFVDPCVMWNDGCIGTNYHCTTKAASQNNSCGHSIYSPPPPKEECLPINGSCQQYSPCRKWPGFCGGPYQCITDIQYYRYTHGPQPGCPVPEKPHQYRPPGECIYQKGNCVWSNCTSYLGICGQYPVCGSYYEYLVSKSTPPPPCPFPGPGYTPPPPPGPCLYNITAQRCQYFANKTHPCTTAICPRGRVCQVYTPTNTAYCQPSCDLDNGGCKQGEKCSLVNETCFTEPCPSQVKCTNPDSSPHPTIDNSNSTDCMAWVDRCTGEHHCTAGGGNSINTSTLTPPNCYPPIPADLTPAPGVCTHISGSCQFVDPCVTWNKECYGTDYQCTSKAQYQNNSCGHSFYAPPPPKEECLPINGSCQQYNPCRKWPGFCGRPYQCITDIQYYRYSHGPQPGCPVPEKPRQKPPGECIYQKGQCVWSDCTSYLGICGQYPVCHSYYEYLVSKSYPPSSCPDPGPGFTPPPQPGPCLYNITAQRCQYFANKTHPCITAICPRGRVCRVYTPTNIAYCQPSCDIDNGGCKQGEKCSLVNVTCFGQPCPPQVKCSTSTVHSHPSPHPIVHSSSTDCMAWVDRCTGEHHCTAGGGNTSTLTPPNCYPPIPADLTPAPGVCTHINGSCQFVDPCVTWNKECYDTDYQCTSKAQSQNNSCYYMNPPPPPKEECLPINGSCQQYNPCRKWPSFCGGPYQCITDIQYYRYTHGPQPDCPEPLHHPIPPGECIYQHGQCVWSNCTSYLGICGQYPVCGTYYDYQFSRSYPPPPCPPPVHGSTPLPQPGPCLYNLTAQKCQYVANKTHPCASAICPTGSECRVYIGNSTNTTYCQPSCEIDNGGCNRGERCSLIKQTCFLQPCPPQVECTPTIDLCATMRCSVGYRCMVDNITGTGYCDPSCDLNNGGCPADQQCVLKQVQCITSPCPPVVECTGISQYEGSSIGGGISPAVVAGIVVGVVVFVGVLLTAVIIISVYTRVTYKRKQQQSSISGSYSLLKGSHLNDD